MPSRKRSRDVSDVDGEEVEFESASSSFRHQASTKRSRVTLARENGGSVVSDDEDEANGILDQDYSEDSPPPIPSHIDAEERDDDALELQATQWVAKQMREFQDNRASEQGVIEEVFCRNFMCHSKLRIKLGPLINFIIGHNGSGKSAVLTALTMCLGGKASSTNRGASLKNLIKEGEDSATLSVKIKNQGDGAFKHDLYGNSIIVERNFTRNGTSGFKLKSANDRIITTKKSELDDVLDFFAFQLDNPINVLTQDMARQFLSNSSPSDKYKFFIRGTQLEVLDADYKLMEEYLDSIEAKLYSRTEDIEELKRKEEEAEREKKRSERTDTIIQKIEALGRQHAWAQVEEQEEILDRYRNSVQMAIQTIQDKTDEAQAVEGVYEGHNQSYEAGRRMVEEQQEQLTPLTNAHEQVKEIFDKVKDELLEKQSEERVVRENMRSLKKTAVQLEADVRKEQTRLAEAEGPEHLQRVQDLENLEAAVEQKRQEQIDHGNGLTELDSAKADAEKELEQGKQRQEQAKEALDRAENSLRSLEQNQGRQFAGYRPNMENLVRAVSRETRWRSKPVGPMGNHIRIKKPEWTSQIERMLGGNLEAFIVTCKEDQALLSDIMTRVKCSCSIFISHATRLDITGKEPAEGIDTVLRILHIDNDLVRNSLIINQSAEQVALVPDRDEAHAFMYEGEKPRNVKATLAFTGRDNRSAVRFEFSGRGDAKSSHVQAWDRHARMKTDIEDQARMQREWRAQAHRALQEATDNVRGLRNTLEKTKQGITRFDRRTKELKAHYQQAQEAVEQKRSEIENNLPEEGVLQELENQLRQGKDDLQADEQSYEDMIRAKDDLNDTQRQNKIQLDAAQRQLDEGKRQVENAKKRFEKLDAARTKALQEKNLALEEVDAANRQKDQLEAKADTQQGVVDSFIQDAERVCRRIPIDEGLTVKTIDERIDKFINERRRAEAEAGGTKEDLLAAWHKAKLEYEEAKAQTETMQKLAKVRDRTTIHHHHTEC